MELDRDARRDAKLCQALRAHVGADVPLMYDGSAGFDLPDAVYLGHALAEAQHLWYEEPMREFSISAYKQLGLAVKVPLEVRETPHFISFLTTAVEIQTQKGTAALAYFDSHGLLLTREPARGGKTLIPTDVFRSIVDETTVRPDVSNVDGIRV